jgi:glucose-6-phosphate 1-dehydrogenase
LFTRDAAVEAAWRDFDPELDLADPVDPYAVGSWGPAGASRVLAGDDGWHDPQPEPERTPC